MFKKILNVIILSGSIPLICFAGIIYCQTEANKRVEFDENLSRDPFIPLLPRKESPGGGQITSPQGELNLDSFFVQGMVWNSDKPQVIINDKIYRLGDEINGAKIIEINKDGVKLFYQERFFLIAPQIKGGKK